jgi:hypothetical protein
MEFPIEPDATEAVMFRSARVLGSILGVALLTAATPGSPPLATGEGAPVATSKRDASFAIRTNARTVSWAQLSREWRTTTPASLLASSARKSATLAQTFQILHSGTLIYPGEWCTYVVTAFYEGRTFVWKRNGVEASTEYPHQSINFTAPSHGNYTYLQVWEYDGETQTNYADLTLYSDQYNAPQPPSTSCYPV